MGVPFPKLSHVCLQQERNVSFAMLKTVLKKTFFGIDGRHL